MIGMDVVAILLECGPVQMQHDMLTPPEFLSYAVQIRG